MSEDRLPGATGERPTAGDPGLAAGDGPTGAEERPEALALPGTLSDQRLIDMGLLIEAHAHLTRVLGAELEAGTGMPLTWLDVLIRLGRTPEHRMTMTELARRVAFTSGGTTRLVDRIAQAGLVERIHCPSDRRSIYVGLTPKGASALAQALAVHLEGLDAHLVAPLSAQDRRALRAGLAKLAGPDPVCGGTTTAGGSSQAAPRARQVRPSR